MGDRKLEFKKKSDAILKLAGKLADEVLISLSSTVNSLTRFGENEITQNVTLATGGTGITLVRDQKSTKIQTDCLEPEKLKPLLLKASEILKYQKKDPDYPNFPKQIKFDQSGSCYSDKTARNSPKDRAELVISHIRRCESEKLLGSGIVSTNETRLAIANSKGLFAYHETTGSNFSTTVMDDKGHSGWATGSNVDISRLDWETVSRTAIEKSKLNRKPRDLEVGEYPVILEPAAVTDMLLFLSYKAFATQAYQEGRSPLQGKLGKKIMSKNLTILDDPFDPLNPGLPFDFEGIKRQGLTLVDKGIFKELPIDLKLSKKMGKPSTGHGLDYPNPMGPFCLNLRIPPGKRSLAEIIRDSDKCLLITHFHYTNIINPNDLTITGTTRDGLYWIEKGKIAYPVKNMRLTESVFRALNLVEEISSEQVFESAFFGGGFIVPSMKLSGFKFTSKTDY
ncbi:MAG: TldD/PmbA family protein [Candidatus Wallbacteria bacterium]|nr:TldD/PmbA family protein [Candidatus Wallbacteria bacterium]